MKNRKILAITSSRADREPLMPVIKALGKNCVHEHGDYTDVTDSCDIADILKWKRPDIVLLLGDQYLTLLHATMVANHGVPIAHVHGGEETLGAVDNAFRHAISKLSYWHFPSCQLHAERIIQMGESPDRVFALGAPGIDALAELMHEILLERPYAVVCYHPETLGSDEENLKLIVDVIKDYKDVVISGANSDKGGKEINDFWKKNFPDKFRKTYPQKIWLSLMRHADVLIGNSSGFIIEGMTLQQMNNGKPEIKIIGDRQKGRYEEAIEMFFHQRFPFGRPGQVSYAIANKLMEFDIPEKPRKHFHVI